jgi:hypothetical protein
MAGSATWLVAAAILTAVQASATEGPAGVDPVFATWRAKADPAVENALGWLRRIQQADGSFPENYGDSTGIPALAGMAFLSKGHLPTEGPYAVAINRSIDFILANQKPEGLFEKGNAGSGPMYAHNIATLFLAEVSGMVDPTRQARIDAALPKALALILRAQAVKKDERNQGGWRYHPGSNDSDTSCSGWALMALRSSILNGAAIPDEAIGQRKIWREIGELVRRADRPLHLAEIGKETGVRDLAGVAYHMRRAEKAGVVQKIGWVGGWVAMG